MIFKAEVQRRWGNTDAYREHAEKTKNYSREKWSSVADGLDTLFGEFALSLKNGKKVDSDEAQSLVRRLRDYITGNYYACTNEILSGLGQMYVADERFKNNIDKHAEGTAEFVSKAIHIYCKG